MRLSATIAILAMTGGVALAQAQAEHQRDCEKPPVVVAAVAPTFPELARVALLQGDMTVQATVDDSGLVTGTEISSSTRSSVGFEEAAIAATKRWKFDPQETCATRQVELLFRFHKPVEEGEASGVEFHPPFRVDVVVTRHKIVILE
jgi:TonB family protein